MPKWCLKGLRTCASYLLQYSQQHAAVRTDFCATASPWEGWRHVRQGIVRGAAEAAAQAPTAPSSESAKGPPSSAADASKVQAGCAVTSQELQQHKAPMPLMDFWTQGPHRYIEVEATPMSSPEALGAAVAHGDGGGAVLAIASCMRSDEFHAPGGMLRAMWPCAPTFSERRVVMRQMVGRRETVSDREAYVGAFLELALSRLLPHGLPLDITAHGTLLHCSGAASGDSMVLYANALSGALAQAGLPCEGLFAAVRVAKRGDAGKVRSTVMSRCRIKPSACRPAQLDRAVLYAPFVPSTDAMFVTLVAGCHLSTACL
jgi:hypothetical protein